MSGHIDPSKEQFRALADAPDEGPIWMLNLLRLRKKAKYEDGVAATGAEAYAIYARESAPFFTKVGGKLVWSARPQNVVIGPEDDRWDLCFVAEYPSLAAFRAMVADPGYQAIVHHRQAAVKDSRLVHMVPGEAGKVFG